MSFSVRNNNDVTYIFQNSSTSDPKTLYIDVSGGYWTASGTDVTNIDNTDVIIKSNKIRYGTEAGAINQSSNAIAIGFEAGKDGQQSDSVAIGYQSGYTNQSFYSVAIGYQAGYESQQAFSVAIGCNAGYTNQQSLSVAIGETAGKENQGVECIAIGPGAGLVGQVDGSIAIGSFAGSNYQQNDAIAIGKGAGVNTQGSNSIAIGNQAGGMQQGDNAIAIGFNAGNSRQGRNSIFIGPNAGCNTTLANTIILNASSNALNANTSNGLYIDPVKPKSSAGLAALFYNANTNSKEITYASSSIRYKKDVRDLDNDTSKIYEVRPRKYVTKDDEQECIGFIAEELAEIDPQFIFTKDGLVEGISWFDMMVYVIAEMKKLKNEITELKNLK